MPRWDGEMRRGTGSGIMLHSILLATRYSFPADVTRHANWCYLKHRRLQRELSELLRLLYQMANHRGAGQIRLNLFWRLWEGFDESVLLGRGTVVFICRTDLEVALCFGDRLGGESKPQYKQANADDPKCHSGPDSIDDEATNTETDE